MKISKTYSDIVEVSKYWYTLSYDNHIIRQRVRVVHAIITIKKIRFANHIFGYFNYKSHSHESM